MKNAVNTIALGIEAGALKAGASQYLEAIEAAKKELKWGQVLLRVNMDFDPEYSENSILLFDFGEVYGIEAMDITKTKGHQDIVEAWFGEGIDFIGDGSIFFGAKNMEQLLMLHLPKNLKTINKNAFYNGAPLASDPLYLPEGLKKIGENAFYGWGRENWYGEKIAEVYIPDTVETIEKNAFNDVPHIYYNGPATWPEGNQYWGAMKMN